MFSKITGEIIFFYFPSHHSYPCGPQIYDITKDSFTNQWTLRIRYKLFIKISFKVSKHYNLAKSLSQDSPPPPRFCINAIRPLIPLLLQHNIVGIHSAWKHNIKCCIMDCNFIRNFWDFFLSHFLRLSLGRPRSKQRNQISRPKM